MTVVTYMLGEIFILIKGGKLLGLVPTIKVLGVSALTIFAFTGLSFFAIARLKSNTALTVVNTILNTLIGFLAGLYIPLGFLSKGIAAVIKAFPLSHAAALLRQIFMEQSLRELQQSVPLQAVAQIKQNYGVDIAIGSHVLGASEMLLIMTVFGLVFYIASALVMQKNKRN